MAPPPGPVNIDKASAIYLEWQDAPRKYYYIQSTSVKGYDPANPPAPPLPPPVYYDLWYKALNAANCKGSVTVHNLSQGVVAPTTVTVYDQNDNVLGTGSTVEFEPSQLGPLYYFKVHTPQTPAAEDVVIDITVNIVSGGPILAGSIIIQNEKAKEPLTAIIGSVQAFNFIRQIPLDTTNYLNGKYGDILPEGTSCIENQTIKGVTLRDKNYGYGYDTTEGQQLNVPLGLATVNDLYAIRRNADGRNFWLSYLFNGTPIVRSLAVTNGVLGPIFDVGGKVTSLCAKAGFVLYYTIESDPQVVRRWDLVNNKRVANLTTPTATVRDIIITSTGDVIVLYIGATSAHVYRYNEAGTLLSSFELPTINSAARINYAGSNPNQYVLWTREPGISLFRWVNLQNNQLYEPIKVREFDVNGGYINVPDLYEKKEGNVYIGPVQRVGPGPSSNFWIQPVAARGGCFVPNFNPPDDEYIPITFPPFNYPDYGQNPSQLPPGGVYPYPPDPPTTPPVIPINPPPPVFVNPANIGGGLVVIDPSNATRHDVYQGRNPGETLQSSIVVYIRTAFLGD